MLGAESTQCVGKCTSRDGGKTFVPDTTVSLMKSQFMLSDTYLNVYINKPKLTTIIVDTCLIIFLIFLFIKPFTVWINRTYFDAKLIRKLYLRSSKKDDDPLQNMLGVRQKKTKKDTDPLFMKSITFSFSDYIGNLIVRIKNMFQRKKKA